MGGAINVISNIIEFQLFCLGQYIKRLYINQSPLRGPPLILLLLLLIILVFFTFH